MLAISKWYRIHTLCLLSIHDNHTTDDVPIVPSVLWCCWLGGRKGIRPVKNLSGGVLEWLFVWSEMQTCIWPSWCHCHSLSLASVKSRLVLPFWYRLTRVVPEKRLLNGCVCVCVMMCQYAAKKLFSHSWCISTPCLYTVGWVTGRPASALKPHIANVCFWITHISHNSCCQHRLTFCRVT